MKTTPQKRKRAPTRSKSSSASKASAQNAAYTGTQDPVSPSPPNDTPGETSSKLRITLEDQQPPISGAKAKLTAPQLVSPNIDNSFQNARSSPATPSPAEGDSGISLPSPEKEIVLARKNYHDLSAEPEVSANAADKGNQVLKEHVITKPATGPAPQPPIDMLDSPSFIDLPHNLGRVPPSIPAGSAGSFGGPIEDIQPLSLNEINFNDPIADIQPPVDTAVPVPAHGANTTTKKTKNSTYGLTPGRTPYPKFKAPSAAACKKVNDLLSKIHGEVIAPQTIPDPSLTITGCGEVPSVLDALIRTLLSGATTGSNSARAFNGLVQRFGTLTEGIGQGSVNWDAVRQASLQDVFKAIQSGGLADIKSKNLKALLDQVYEENQERKNRHMSENSSPTSDSVQPRVSDQATEAEEVKQYDIASANEHYLNLQYIHKYKTSKALKALIRYPGIGPKTAACVLLFCLQRPCFAVDTHIFRICKWLGWVPKTANEITAFSHLDVRIPDEFKYSLHQLLIKHGKECPRCRAITSPASADWGKGCAIEALVKRTGKRKGGPPSRKTSLQSKATKVEPASRASKRVAGTAKKSTKEGAPRATIKTAQKKAKATSATKKAAGKTTQQTKKRKIPAPTAAPSRRSARVQNLIVKQNGEKGSDFKP
ncbi:uncharacterized protein N7482_005102 [Penicillium canariense]|uniref:HhH-GPD domain-containing protein n=1 Tax=Penicillium canariense TaxID=189055 RepID=A0A9W9I397_9EURO|nr:uncharacterized protein N7482_005102 [Penicillium canariense]KAJ5166321.1 hypothetical protein N7482_005102 [Penicillium canariense]